MTMKFSNNQVKDYSSLWAVLVYYEGIYYVRLAVMKYRFINECRTDCHLLLRMFIINFEHQNIMSQMLYRISNRHHMIKLILIKLLIKK